MTMEQWDAYTRDGAATGETLIRGEGIPEGLYHLVCEVLVRHADGSVLCMKRAQSKPNYPGYYEATAGGSALKGEDKLACIRRELKEETGIVCDSFREVGCHADESTQTIYCSYVCTVDCDKTAVTLQEGETEAFVWMEESEFALFLKSDKMIDPQKRRFLPYYKEMNWFRYRLLALDLDGTLLNSKGEISKENARWIGKAIKSGVHVTISTGRSWHGARAYAEKLRLQAPIITYNGATIVDPATEEALFAKELCEADARLAMEAGLQKGATLCIWSKGELYALPIDDRARDYVRFAGVEPMPAQDTDALAKRGITKVLWYDSAHRVPALWEEMKKAPFSCVTVCPSNPMFLEFFHGAVSKAAALEKVGELLGIHRSEMIAVGDGANDLDMLAYAGLGVAMGNASDAVKKQADAVTATNDENGVARVIERYLLC